MVASGKMSSITPVVADVVVAVRFLVLRTLVEVTPLFIAIEVYVATLVSRTL